MDVSCVGPVRRKYAIGFVDSLVRLGCPPKAMVVHGSEARTEMGEISWCSHEVFVTQPVSMLNELGMPSLLTCLYRCLLMRRKVVESVWWPDLIF